MSDTDPKIQELESRLDSLVRTQISFQTEISAIRRELSKLRGDVRPVQAAAEPQVTPYAAPPEQTPPPVEPAQPREVPPPTFGTQPDEAHRESQFSRYISDYSESARSDLEKFIGENLISKIGIVVLILGVGIGAKYAIDNGWISPLMRIVFGYVIGFVLVGLAVKLKVKYRDFSAVLLSGGMAIMYFVTYFAYAYYALMPQSAAFLLMTVFTLFTVASALIYERQVIAHIGLVGAYAVPFLLSSETGNYLFLFSYMAIINGGILAISILRYWRPLFYTSFLFTWVIYLAWFSSRYSPDEYLYLAMLFLAVFFGLFYAARIVHGLKHDEHDEVENIVSTIMTAAVFYLFCFGIGNELRGVQQLTVFFSYLAAISLVILITSFRFYGRILVYVAYPFTWLIFGAWFAGRYDASVHFALASVFAAVFFAVFYAATLIYRLMTDDIGRPEATALMMTNSFVFYGFGYAVMDSREELQKFEGIFTVGHALLHSIVAQFVSRFRSSAVDVVQILAILVVTFATLAVPVQFDGNIVTMAFAVEAAALFWFGRARQIPLFEYFAYPVMLLATFSLFGDWITLYTERTSEISELNRQPLMNGDLVTALVFFAAFAFIFAVNRDSRNDAAIGSDAVRPFGVILGALTLFVLWNTFRIEIGNYFHLQLVGKETVVRLASLLEPTLTRRVDDVVRFNFIWQLNYTIFFLIAMAAVNLRKARSLSLAFANSALGIVTIQIFVTMGLYLFYELRVSYLSPDVPQGSTLANIAIRYISYAFAVGLLASLYAYSRSELLTNVLSRSSLRAAFDAVLYSALFIAASCELVNLMEQFRVPDSTKLGLSILWGVYALMLIALGIWMSKKYLRIAAIALLAVTLVKLFLYDVADLPTIPKTILFVSLGILLLIVSFLYNKYTRSIFKEPAGDE